MAATVGATVPGLEGELVGAGGRVLVRVVAARPYSLCVEFPGLAEPPLDGTEWLELQLRELRLTGCRFMRHQVGPARRASDPPAPLGQGQLVFTQEVYELSNLLRKGLIIDLPQRMRQLPMMWARRKAIEPNFRDYTAALLFDLQVYRSLLDDIDRRLLDEPAELAEGVRAAAIAQEWPRFRALFDERLEQLEGLGLDFSPEAHEQHGYYFRRHVWDLILQSEFLRRTNLKPRGYPGDSEMMRMVYEREFRGPGIFARLLHRHPIETHAAQAVRNRVEFLAATLRQRQAEQQKPLRVISVACGPARELRQLFLDPAMIARFELTLLDQDAEALADARNEIRAAAVRHGAEPPGRFIRDSVRTMLRTSNLAELWGQYDFAYSMGLFDYLTAPVARAVLARMYDLLAPGGELIVGNFHTGNRTRVYMEYWMDWVLIYRTESDMLALARGLEGAECHVEFEGTQSQMFMRIRRPK